MRGKEKLKECESYFHVQQFTEMSDDFFDFLWMVFVGHDNGFGDNDPDFFKVRGCKEMWSIWTTVVAPNV